MRLAEVSSRLSDVSERYKVPERVHAGMNMASEAAHTGMSMASEAARKGADVAYRVVREYPRTSATAGAIVAAALIGGLLWYMFGDPRRPVERRRKPQRVRAKTERRTRAKAATQ
jgi:hypothetical protein